MKESKNKVSDAFSLFLFPSLKCILCFDTVDHIICTGSPLKSVYLSYEKTCILPINIMYKNNRGKKSERIHEG